MPWHPSRTGTVALCAVLTVLSSVFVAGADRRPLQAAGAQRGTLAVKVPRGLLPSEDYWVYVNREIVSAPPHGAFATLANELMHSGASPGSDSESYWDASGRAVLSEAGRFTYLRPGLRERIFARESPIQLVPGKYIVDLVTRAADAPFPFTFARFEVSVAAGKTAEIEFGIPTGTSEMRVARAERCSTCSFSGHPPEQTLKFIQDDLTRTQAALEKVPMVAVLNEALLSLPIDPARRPTVYARLPAAIGGGRDLDARQISLIVEALWWDYRFTSIRDNTTFNNAAPPVPELAAFLEVKIAAHNRRLADYRKIVQALEQAKRQ